MTIREVEFTSVDSLTSALRGIDAVIDCTPHTADVGPRLIDASAAAGVRHYVPSDFGVDPTNPGVAGIPALGRKQAAFRRVQDLAREGKLTWTIVACGPFLDWNLATGFAGIDIPRRKAMLFDGGENVTPWTSLASVAKAVAQVLLRPKETANRAVYVHDVYMCQKEMLEAAYEAVGGPEGWEVGRLDMQAALAKALTELRSRNITATTFQVQIQYALSDKELCHRWERDDNELLGLKGMSREEVIQIIKGLAEEKKD